MRIATASFILFMLLFACKLSAQIKVETIKVKKETDTLDYSYLVRRFYNLYKMTEYDRSAENNCFKTFLVYDSVNFRNWGFWDRDTIRLKKSDTLLYMSWYPLNNGTCLGNGNHSDLWKLRLNKRGNTIIVERALVFPAGQLPKEGIKTLMFKIIKISWYELILEDLPITPKHRRYYFSKR